MAIHTHTGCVFVCVSVCVDHLDPVLVLFASWLYTHTKAVLVCMSVGVDHLDPVLVLFVGDATHKAVNVMGYAVLIQMQ